jgi:hypothetical protein
MFTGPEKATLELETENACGQEVKLSGGSSYVINISDVSSKFLLVYFSNVKKPERANSHLLVEDFTQYLLWQDAVGLAMARRRIRSIKR